MTVRRRPGLYFRFRPPEQLELRDMLSGHAFAAGFARFADAAAQWASYQNTATAMIAQVAAHNRVFAALGATSASEATVLAASLADPNGSATGTVTYKTGTYDGVSQTELSVSVIGATASNSLDVSVGGTVVGQLATDETGAGMLVLSSDPSGTQQPLPSNFPADVTAGTAVSVDTLTGTLAAATHSGRGCDSSGSFSGSEHSGDGCESAQTVLIAALADPASSATGTVTYQTGTKHGTTLTQLTVNVSGATASSPLDVSIDGTVVGQVTTDTSGAGTMVLSSNPTGSQQLLPSNFPNSIAAGTNVTVGTLSGTFDTSTSAIGQAFHFGRRR